MSIEPIELYLDPRALRRGLVYPVDPDTDPGALCVQDSGMVPISTRVAVVNPETNQLCHIGEYGEIWVQSEACAKAFYRSKETFDEERFNGRLVGDAPDETYVRTGDLGFLHNVTRPVGANNQPVEMQILFVLGNIGETFEINGLNHFPIDIENSIERCHGNITPGGSAVFQAGGMVVVVVEVYKKGFLASMVPVIVNAVLNEHQIIVDIISFVGSGDFPRSRLGEKQRGKILASWVTRKLRAIAQYGIRDPDGGAAFLDHERRASTMVLNRASSQEPRQSMQSEQHSSPLAQSTPRVPPDAMSHRSSIMPELPLQLPSDHYHLDTTGMFDRRSSTRSAATQKEAVTEAPVVALNDRPYPLQPADSYELATPYHDDNTYPTDDPSEHFFDPNADPQRPYGDYTPMGSDENLPEVIPYENEQNQRPQLHIANPGDYHQGSSLSPANSNTPTTTSASNTATATPTSTYPLSASTVQGPVSSHYEDSPYSDGGNPFSEHIPHGVPAFDFPANNRRSYAPPQQQPRQESPATKGRALLPSQMQRMSSYEALPRSGSPIISEPRGGYANPNYNPAERHIPRKPSRNEMKEEQEQQQQGNRSNGGGGYSGGLTVRNADPAPGRGGSVRRRYDGSGYGDYEY